MYVKSIKTELVRDLWNGKISLCEATQSKIHKFLSKNNFESSDSRDSQDVTELGIFIINPSALSVAIAVNFTYNPLFSKVIEQMTDVHRKVRPVILLFPSVEIAYL